jgi:hypothetical protein
MDENVQRWCRVSTPKTSAEWNKRRDVACVDRGVADAQDLKSDAHDEPL